MQVLHDYARLPKNAAGQLEQIGIAALEALAARFGEALRRACVIHHWDGASRALPRDALQGASQHPEGADEALRRAKAAGHNRIVAATSNCIG